MTVVAVVSLALLLAMLTAGYVLVVRGSLTVDLGLGRRLRPLGPLERRIAAPREVVFDVASAPYLASRTPRALQRRLRVLERSENMVLAEHYTRVGPLVTTTLETVRFERPERVHFRLVRGPVPYASEHFSFRDEGDATVFEYAGELGTDLWWLGRAWGYVVALRWEAAVRESMEGIAAEAERQAARASTTRA